jgi:hypothetical protein
MSTPEPTITVYVLNGNSTSAGNGPGYADLPAGEALWFIGQGLAVRGSSPPIGAEGSHGPVAPP